MLKNEVIILDNLSNSKIEVLDKINKITGKSVKFYEVNMIDKNILEKIFNENNIDAVIDFAAYKAVGESVKKPIEYYTNNIATVLNLLDVMKKYNCKKIVFSSSATVYGNPEIIPITEECKTGGTTNPYGTSKLFVEQILKDLYKSDNEWDMCILRYFNPIGAHESGLIGEEPNGIKINYKIAPRREGDIAICYSDPTKAREELGFIATKSLEDMCRDSWNYEKNN